MGFNNFFTWDLEDLKSFTLSETKNDMEQSKINDHSFIDEKAELKAKKKESCNWEFSDYAKDYIINEVVLSIVTKLMEEHGYEMRKGIGNCVFKSSGIKYDEGKTQFHLLIPEFVKGVADVMTFGAQKYSAWNYLGLDRERIIDAHHRHINAYQRGELNDSETGLSHLFHATCCLQMLWALDNEFHRKEEKRCQT